MNCKRQLLLLSTSTIYGTDYLEYARKEVDTFLKRNNVSKVLFIPYALGNHDDYAKKASPAFTDLGYGFASIHNSQNPVDAVNNAEAFFIGGGNTFLLLKSLYQNALVEPIRKRVLTDGIPYIGSSAGTNVATVSIATTNDMPIVHVPTLTALELLPFNINPHYVDPIPGSTHMGETREIRIKQYHELPETPPVVGLREGSMLLVEGNTINLLGNKTARLFFAGKQPVEYPENSNLSFLINYMDPKSN